MLLHLLEPDPARRPTMAQARDELVVAALGDVRNAAYLLGSPIRGADGGMPAWVRGVRPAPPPRSAAPVPVSDTHSAATPLLIGLGLIVAVVAIIAAVVFVLIH